MPLSRSLLPFALLIGCGDKELDDTATDTAADVVVDEDGDGFASAEDCDDSDAEVNPAADERCDGVDNNCDGAVDDASSVDAQTFYGDGDQDGFGAPDQNIQACEQPPNTSTVNTDCDDGDPGAYPGADEVCDGVDNDCDRQIDGPDALDAVTFYLDTDSDSYGDINATMRACELPEGAVEDSTDCDDTMAEVNPAADELCSTDYDDDCDGQTNEDAAVDASTWYADTDADGYGDPNSASLACLQPSGRVGDNTDCDDSAAGTHPGAAEICDANDTDEDCDGLADDGDSSVDTGTMSSWYTDADADGYGDINSGALTCDASSGQVADATDCDDGDAAINPGAAEICDANDTDEDCDGLADDDDSSADASTMSSWYADADADGYGDPNASTLGCDVLSGEVSDDSDCDDTDATISPLGTETCDGQDQDCDSSVDEGGYLNVPGAYATITDAIAAAIDGDEVCVAAGMYTEQLDFAGLDISVIGVDRDSTIIDAASAGSVVTFENGETDAAELMGFTITGGQARQGSGVYISGSSPTLSDLLISGNDYTGTGIVRGAGVYINGGDPLLEQVELRENTVAASNNSVYGGVIYMTGAAATLEGVTIADNDITSTSSGDLLWGSAIYAEGDGSDVLANNLTVTGNAASGPVYAISAVFIDDGDFTLVNGIIAGNSYTSTSDNAGGGIIGYSADSVNLTNVSITGENLTVPSSGLHLGGLLNVSTPITAVNFSIDNILLSSTGTVRAELYYDFSGSEDLSFSNFYSTTTNDHFYSMSNPTGVNSNLSADPLYADVTSADPGQWDLTLQSTSPLIDVGDPTHTDPDGTNSDVGAWGGPGAADW